MFTENSVDYNINFGLQPLLSSVVVLLLTLLSISCKFVSVNIKRYNGRRFVCRFADYKYSITPVHHLARREYSTDAFIINYMEIYKLYD